MATMENSRTVTTVFMVVTVIALVVLAFSVSRNNDRSEDFPESYALAGLAENLRSLQRVTDFPDDHVHVVQIERTNGEELTAVKASLVGADFVLPDDAPADLAPFSELLYANSVLLDAQAAAEDFAFIVTGYRLEKQIGRLSYSSFDGLIIEQTVYLSGEDVWMKISAKYDPLLAEKFRAGENAQYLLNTEQVRDLADRLNGRVYKAAK